MEQDKISTRRSFLKGGAIIAAPLAMVGAPAAAMAMDGSKERLARLEDEKAIRALHQGLLRQLNSGVPGAAASLFAEPNKALIDASLKTIAADHAGHPDSIDLSANGARAAGRFACLVETRTMIPADNTLAQMAHAQGDGYVTRTEARTMAADFVKTPTGWAIAGLDFA